MKTSTILLSGAIAAFTVLSAVPALADSAYATRNVNVRSGPGLNFEVVDKLVADEPVDKGNCNTDGTWCYVRHEGTNGWVAAVFLTATPPGQQDTSTTDTSGQSASGSDSDYKALRKVNVRTGPSTNYAVVDQLTGGEAVTRGQCTADGTWCYITHDGADGWVSASFLAPVNAPATPETPSTGTSDNTIYIAKSPVNVRTGPATSYAKVDRLDAGEQVEIAQCNNDNTWCYVSHDGPDGWVAANYLTTATQPGANSGGNTSGATGNSGSSGNANTSGSGSSGATVTQKMGTAIANMPVRGAPTLFTSTVGRLNRGDAVPIDSCSADGYWCHVKNDSVDGWVPSAFLQISEVEVPAPASASGNQAVTAMATPMRQGPGDSFAQTATLAAGTAVTVERCGPRGNWCKVTAGANAGWVSANALKAPEAAPSAQAAPATQAAPPDQQKPNSLCFTGFGGLNICLSQ